mgnify:CR=1 FL=1
MFSNADEALKFIQDEGVQFVDVRFCDLPGIMQHFNVPAASVGTDSAFALPSSNVIVATRSARSATSSSGAGDGFAR